MTKKIFRKKNINDLCKGTVLLVKNVYSEEYYVIVRNIEHHNIVCNKGRTEGIAKYNYRKNKNEVIVNPARKKIFIVGSYVPNWKELLEVTKKD